MTIPLDLRTRKRLATRQAISDAATRLFLERGFDQVTVDEIAAEADVGRKTVFNHFPRKEDMFFDRIDEVREIMQGALLRRDAGVAPVEALRLLAHRLMAEQSPYVSFSFVSQGWIEAVAGSETLQARARAIRDELAQALTVALAESVGRKDDDSSAVLAGSLLLAVWSVSILQARRTLQQRGTVQAAQAAFLALIDQGAVGVQAAMNGTPYA